ncbi:7982_t:CDS:2 [Gigaspora margarita]|uniref:7982_t:CDS:1 n=1 Tax=Gigaspora margarita TaxID=4874 RepID=A0ABN7WTK8_GIGMA|nr:7982_t:CDS:2 [Gigaspora margarita]
MDCLFGQVEDIQDKTIKSYLAKIYRDYQNSKKKGGEIDFFFQVQDEPEVITYCIHKPEFTNAISKNSDYKAIIANFFQIFHLSCRSDLKTLLDEEHFHLVNSPVILKKIAKLSNNKYLTEERILQMPLGQEPRLYGYLEKVKYTDIYLFKVLLFDPNHLVYPKGKMPNPQNLTCLFSKTDCLATRKLGIKK